MVIENTQVQIRILTSKDLNKYVKNIYYVETTLSDHSIVVLHFKNDDVERGPGILILHNLLFSDDIYKGKIVELIEREKACILYNTSLLVWWDNLKSKLRSILRVIVKEGRKNATKNILLYKTK